MLNQLPVIKFHPINVQMEVAIYNTSSSKFCFCWWKCLDAS